MKFLRYALFLFGLSAEAMLASQAKESTVLKSLDIAPVWSALPVGFCFLTHPPHQYVAYYDAQPRMKVAQRNLDEEKWTYKALPLTTVWDSHN